MKITLPKKRSEVTSFNPSLIVLYGKPKQGKSTIIANLEDNLVLDLEEGYRGLSVMKLCPKKASEILQIQDAIKKEIVETGNKPYRFITIDNATRIEDFAIPYASYLYSQTSLGKNWDISKDVRTLPNGAGWQYMREAIDKLINPFRELCETLIVVGHVKKSQINLNGENVDEMSFDLTGKSATLLLGIADAVGYVYREKEIIDDNNEKDVTYISFESKNNTICESRCPHLRGQRIAAIVTENGETKIDTSKLFV